MERASEIERTYMHAYTYVSTFKLRCMHACVCACVRVCMHAHSSHLITFSLPQEEELFAALPPTRELRLENGSTVTVRKAAKRSDEGEGVSEGGRE